MLKTHNKNYLNVRSNKFLLGVFFVALLVSFFTINLNSRSVGAEPNVADPVLKYCENLDLPKKALNACSTTNVNYARNTATYKCDAQASSDKKVACVESKAKTFFRDAAKTKPKTSLEMTQALDRQFTKALRGTGGTKNKPAAGFGSLAPEGQTCQGGSCSDPAADPNAKCDNDSCDFIKKYVNPTINLLTISFGLIAVASLIFAGIQYSASSGDPQKISAAKNRIVNTIIAIVAYFFLYGFLQFLIPGGAFNR